MQSIHLFNLSINLAVRQPFQTGNCRSIRQNMWKVTRNITRNKSRSAPIICEAVLPDEMNRFCAPFDLLNKESFVKSTPPPEDLLVSTEDVRQS